MTDFIPVGVEPLLLVPRGARVRFGLYHDETTDEINRITCAATVAATLGVPVTIAATVPGEAAVAGDLSVNQTAAAISTGVSTAAANLDIDIAGQSHGASSVVGELDQASSFIDLEAWVDGIGKVAGPNVWNPDFGWMPSNVVLNFNQAATGSPAGKATVTGRFHIDLKATVAGTSTLTGDATVESAPVHQSNGAATVTGELTQHHALTVTTPGVATVTAQANQTGNSTAISTGVSTVTADLSKFGGTTAGSSTVTGTLHGVQTLAAAPAGKTTITANTVMWLNSPATVNGTATVVGELSGFGPGPIAGTAAVVGDLTPLTLGVGTGTSSGKATVTATLTAYIPLLGTHIGVATVTAELTPFGPGPIAGTSTVTVNLGYQSIGVPNDGIQGASSVIGQFEILHHTANGQASVTGLLAGAAATQAVITSGSNVTAFIYVDGPFEVALNTIAQVAAAAFGQVSVNAQAAKSSGDGGPTPQPCKRPLARGELTRAVDFV